MEIQIKDITDLEIIEKIKLLKRSGKRKIEDRIIKEYLDKGIVYLTENEEIKKIEKNDVEEIKKVMEIFKKKYNVNNIIKENGIKIEKDNISIKPGETQTVNKIEKIAIKYEELHERLNRIDGKWNGIGEDKRKFSYIIDNKWTIYDWENDWYITGEDETKYNEVLKKIMNKHIRDPVNYIGKSVEKDEYIEKINELEIEYVKNIDYIDL